MLMNSRHDQQDTADRSRDALYRQDNKSMSRMTSATETTPAKAVNPMLRMSSMTEQGTTKTLKKGLKEGSITSMPFTSSFNSSLVANIPKRK